MAWTLGKAKVKTNHFGRRFATWVATSDEGLHRTRTVVLRHDRNGMELATVKEARAMALRSVGAKPEEVHLTFDGGDNEWMFEEG